MSRKLSPGRYEELKALGADLIEHYDLVYPLEPLEIADSLGVHVSIHREGLPPTAACATVDGYTQPVQSPHGTKFQIHMNGAMPYLRQRFTLMHEIAHIWLDHPRADTSLSDEQAEGEANFLANYLLAPDILVILWNPELSIAGIAETFRMSDEAADLAHRRVIRALNLRAVDKAHDKRILASATRRVESTAPALSSLLGLA